MTIIRGQTRTKAERIKEETGAVGTVVDKVDNIRGQTRTKTERIKEETEAVRTVIGLAKCGKY